MVQTDRGRFIGEQDIKQGVKREYMLTPQGLNGLREARALHPHSFSYESRRMISESKDGIKYKILPLLLREISVGSIVEIGGYNTHQVEAVVNRLRKSDLPPSTVEQTQARKIRGQIEKKRRSDPARLMSIGPRLEAARLLFRSSLFGENLFFWNTLRTVYQKEGVDSPEEPADQLLQEAFLKGCVDYRVMEMYEQLYERMDEENSLAMIQGERFVLNRTKMGRSFLAKYVSKEFPAVFYTTALKILGNEDDALDVANDLYIQILQNGAGIFPWRKPARERMSYLIAMAKNRAFDILRERKKAEVVFVPFDPRRNGASRIGEIHEVDLVPDDNPLAAVAASNVNLATPAEEVAVNNFSYESLRQQAPIAVFVHYGMKLHEVAAMQGVSYNTMKARARAERQRVKKILDKEQQNESQK